MTADRFQSAGVRFPIAMGVVMPVFALYLAIPSLTHTKDTLTGAMLASLVACALGWAAYAAYVRRIERRAVSELSTTAGAGRELSSGVVLGAAMFTTPSARSPSSATTPSTAATRCRSWRSRS